MAVSLGIPQVTALLPGNQESAPDAQAPAMDSDLQLPNPTELTDNEGDISWIRGIGFDLSRLDGGAVE